MTPKTPERVEKKKESVCLSVKSSLFGNSSFPLAIKPLQKHTNQLKQAHSWANLKKPAKNKIEKKIVKSTHYSYACNSLTSFEYEGYVMTGNGNYVTWLKFGKSLR